MIDQSKQEVAEAMKQDPETWAELYLTQMEQLSEMMELLQKYREALRMTPPGERGSDILN